MDRIRCPNCGRESSWENNPFRPFCCEKCKLADLSRWLNEEYSVVVEEPTFEEGETNSSP
jgi:endogenous inhibitor of DNA gyrase (YacG/DUF329 family)